MKKHFLTLLLIICIVASTLLTVDPVSAGDEYLDRQLKIGDTSIDWRPGNSGPTTVREDGIRQAIRTDAVSYNNYDNPTDIDLTDEELCECTPGNGSRKPGPIQQWSWNNGWSDSPPVENAISTCVNQYWMEYTAQPNHFVIWQFATKEEAQSRFEIERDAQDQWLSTWKKSADENTSSALEIGEEAQYWHVPGAGYRVLARWGQFVLYGVADDFGEEPYDFDGDGVLERDEFAEPYEIAAFRFTETIDCIKTLMDQPDEQVPEETDEAKGRDWGDEECAYQRQKVAEQADTAPRGVNKNDLKLGIIGTVVGQMGDTTLDYCSGGEGPIAKGGDIVIGDCIRTGSNGRLLIEFTDRDDERGADPTSFYMSPNSELCFDGFSVGLSRIDATIEFIKGTIRKITNGWSRHEIKTIKVSCWLASEVVLSYDPDTETFEVYVLEGSVEVTNSETGETITLRDNQKLIAEQGVLGQIEPLSQEEWDSLIAEHGLTDENNPTEMVESRTVIPGGTVKVPVRLENVEDIGSLNFNVTYDSSVINIDRVDEASLLSGISFVVNPNETGIIRFGFATVDGVSGTGPIGYIICDAVGNDGSYTPLTISGVEATDSSGNPVTLQTINGSVTINSDRVIGDSNGDGILTELDALAALRMSVNLMEEDLVLDMDQDGRVTAKDALAILSIAVRGR